MIIESSCSFIGIKWSFSPLIRQSCHNLDQYFLICSQFHIKSVENIIWRLPLIQMNEPQELIFPKHIHWNKNFGIEFGLGRFRMKFEVRCFEWAVFLDQIEWYSTNEQHKTVLSFCLFDLIWHELIWNIQKLVVKRLQCWKCAENSKKLSLCLRRPPILMKFPLRIEFSVRKIFIWMLVWSGEKSWRKIGAIISQEQHSERENKRRRRKVWNGRENITESEHRVIGIVLRNCDNLVMI